MANTTVLDPLLPSMVVHQFPMPTWLENLAIRSNGQILVTLTTTPEVFLVDSNDPLKSVSIHRFPDIVGMCAIVEVEDDKFYVAGGNFDLNTLTNESKSHKLWEIDMSNFDSEGKAAVKEVMKLSNVGFPNGLGLLSKSEKTILAADCEVGAVIKIDLANGTYETVIEVDDMKNPEQPFIPVAINGIAVYKDYLYWTNTSKALFCRIKIHSDGKAAGENPLNTIMVVKATGGSVAVAGNIAKLEIAGATACQFDRRSGYEHLLYVVTTGGLGGPVNGSEMEGGKLSVIDTSSFKA